jgi:hypothetical protein
LLQSLRQVLFQLLVIRPFKLELEMCQCPELIRFDDTERALMSVEYSSIPIFKLAVLHQFSEGLRERLEINQQLLIVLKNVKVLFSAHHLE